MKKIRLIIADDHSIFRNGLKMILEEDEAIDILGEASDGLQAVDLVGKLLPDILMLDISMPNMNGLEAVAIIDAQFSSSTKVLMLSMHNNEDYISKSIENGASGYLLKDASKEEVLEAIHTVAEGGRYFTDTVSSIIIDSFVNKTRNKNVQDDKTKANLSKKEKEILDLIVAGLNSREIAEKLGLSTRTVDNHRAHIMKKNQVKNAAELVKMAVEYKW